MHPVSLGDALDHASPGVRGDRGPPWSGAATVSCLGECIGDPTGRQGPGPGAVGEPAAAPFVPTRDESEAVSSWVLVASPPATGGAAAWTSTPGRDLRRAALRDHRRRTRSRRGDPRRGRSAAVVAIRAVGNGECVFSPCTGPQPASAAQRPGADRARSIDDRARAPSQYTARWRRGALDRRRRTYTRRSRFTTASATARIVALCLRAWARRRSKAWLTEMPWWAARTPLACSMTSLFASAC